MRQCSAVRLPLDASLATEYNLVARKPERAVCLDEGFAGNDQLKANAVQIFKTLHQRGDEGEKSDVTVFRTV